MKKKISRREVLEKIDDFFKGSGEFKPKDVRKIKRLAMAYNIKLGKYRKLFCKKCFADLRKEKVRVKNGFKSVECGECKAGMRWRIG